MWRLIRYKYKSGNNEAISFQALHTLGKPTCFRADRLYIHCRGNLLINGEAKIKPLLRLINTTLQGLRGYQK